MTKYTEISVGTRYERLVTTSAPYSVKHNGKSHTMVDVLCDCGETKLVRTTSLVHGKTRSCGCLQREAISVRKISEAENKRKEKYGTASIKNSEEDKWCPGCEKFHHISAFGSSKHKSSGLNTYCKEYNNKKRKQNYKINSERERKASLKYYHSHIEQVKKYRFKYVRMQKLVFARANAKRRAALIGAEIDTISAQDYDKLLQEYNNSCWICHRTFDVVQLNWDHYQPLSKGGNHSKENLRPACADCNRSKHSKWPLTEEMLEEIRNFSLTKL